MEPFRFSKDDSELIAFSERVRLAEIAHQQVRRQLIDVMANLCEYLDYAALMKLSDYLLLLTA